MCIYICVCVGGFGVAGGQVDCDPGPLIYQRPHLSDMSYTFLLSYDGRKPPLTTLLENGSFGRSLMLMSRPGLGLRAVNRELMRLVVCLCTVVTRLKDGPCPKQLGSFQASQALTQRPCPGGLLSRLYSFFSICTPCSPPSQSIMYVRNFIMHKSTQTSIGF